MATEEKKRSARPSNNVRKRKASGKSNDDPKHSPQAGADDIASRIEQKVEERLQRLESRLERRLKPLKIEEEDDVSENGEDADIEIKKLRPSTRLEKARKRRKRGLLGKLLSAVPGAPPQDYDELIDHLERMDEFGKVPDVDTTLEKIMMFLYKKYWRVTTEGLKNIPNEGRALIVSNHSGVLPFDGAMIATAIYKFHPAERYTRFMIEDWFGRLPFASEFMTAVGQVRACQENAERLLRQEQLVGVFPEGIKGMAKGFKNRYNLARFGRGGVIRLAIRTRAPVIPTAVVGAEEIYIVLGYANWLGKMFGMPLFPLSATFPWLGPLGFIPLPTKWYIQFGSVIRYDEYDESALNDNVIINRLNRQLRATVQDMVDSLLKKRRSLFFG
jgi:1-acyl-sn-glycerol-3-phosphate acyltransferase